MVYHRYKVYGFCDEKKEIGLFSSKKNAEKAIKKIKNQKGFKKYKEGFYIKKYYIDIFYKEKKLIYVKSKGFTKKIIYVLEYDIECIKNNIIGFFSTKKRANNAFLKIKNKNNILLQSTILNKIYWDGGFVTISY